MAGGVQRWSNGPWKRVRNTPSAFNNAPDELVSATNIYLQDTVNGSGAFARWGYKVQNVGDPLGTYLQQIDSGACVHTHIDSAGTVYNFIIACGKLYRVSDAEDCILTDVSPATGVDTVNPWMVSFNGHLVIGGDGVDAWVATNLSSTPVTKTDIAFSSTFLTLQTRGIPVEYAGSLVFILNTLAQPSADASVTKIVWSAPGDPLTGYEQNPYDFSWTLLASDSEPLNGLWATNLALYYFREHSIGALTGTPATAGSTSGSDFRNSSTQDAISAEVGCVQPKTIQQFGNNIFFLDGNGRPWMMALGGFPAPIWQQMQSILAGEQGFYYKQIGNSQLTRQFATSSLFPALGLYLVANFNGTANSASSNLHVFDARSGAYEGEWLIADGYPILAQGMITSGTWGALRHVLVTPLSTTLSGSSNLYMWATGTSAVSPNWADDSRNTPPGIIVPTVSVTTPRFGFDADLVQNVDKVTAITGTGDKVSMTVSTPQDTVTVTPTPLSASTDGTFRAVSGAQVFGRGITVAISPDYDGSVPSNQWSVQQIVAQGVSSLAGPDDV